MNKFRLLKLLILIVGISFSAAAFSHGGGGHVGGHEGGGQSNASSSHEANNHANQLNPNNDAYWQSRGYPEKPDDWEARTTSSYDDNHANQLNPNNQAYSQSRGVNYETTQIVVSLQNSENNYLSSLTLPLTEVVVSSILLFLLFKRRTIIKKCAICKTKNRIKPHTQKLKPICSHCKSDL